MVIYTLMNTPKKHKHDEAYGKSRNFYGKWNLLTGSDSAFPFVFFVAFFHGLYFLGSQRWNEIKS